MIRRPLRRPLVRNGFSIVELLVVAAALGILLTASIQAANNALRREEGITVVLSVAGWLEEIRSNAVRLNQFCQVTFDTSITTDVSTQGSPINPGERIARVEPASCALEQELQLASTGFAKTPANDARKMFKIGIIYNEGDSNNGPVLTFTPLGGVTLTKRFLFMVASAIDSQRSTQRCVRIQPVIGVIGVGKLPSGNESPRCVTTTYDDAI